MVPTKQLSELLVSVLKERTEPKAVNQVIGNLNHSDWQALFKVVVNLGLFPSFYNRLSALKLDGLASDFLHQFKDAYLLNLQKNLFCEQELLKIISHLKSYDIEVIALKGPILARLFYQDMAFRQAPADLDLLVKKEDLPQARRILEEIGYSRLQIEPKKDFLQPAQLDNQITQICLTKKTHDLWSFSLDIHTSIRGFFRREQINSLWQQARYVSAGEADVLLLSNEDLLLYLSVISLSLLESVQLRYLYDMHRLVSVCQKELNWDKLFYQAKKYDLSSCLYFPLVLSRSFFATEIPDNFLKNISPCRSHKKFVNLCIDQEQLLLHPNGIQFNLIARLIFCRYLYSRDWGDFLKKLFTRSISGYSRSQTFQKCA